MTRLAAFLFDPAVLRPLFWLLLATALFFALDPRPPHLPIDRFGDKFAHMLAFAALTGVAVLGWRETPAWRIALRLSLFGAAIELLQMVPALQRTSDVRDWVADSVAIALAALFAQLLVQFLPKRETT